MSSPESEKKVPEASRSDDPASDQVDLVAGTIDTGDADIVGDLHVYEHDDVVERMRTTRIRFNIKVKPELKSDKSLEVNIDVRHPAPRAKKWTD